MLKIGFIGAGKVGTTLGQYFVSQNLPIIGYYSTPPESTIQAAKCTGTQQFTDIAKLVESCDLIFITVPDSAIHSVWQQIRNLSIKNKYICHCSGMLSSLVFDGIEDTGAYGYAVHPLYAFGSTSININDLSGIHFTVEGNASRLHEIISFFTSLGNPIASIVADQKPLYHAASVMVSNLVVALAHSTQSLFIECGLDKQFANSAWKKLLLNNAENICSLGPINALTGPIERGDLITLQAHLACLDNKFQKIYIELSQILVDVAKIKHPKNNYSLIEMELKSAKYRDHFSATENK